MLLFSIGIVGLVRLLGTAVKDTGEIEYRAQAATLADEQIGRMWVDRANLGGYEVADDRCRSCRPAPARSRSTATL